MLPLPIFRTLWMYLVATQYHLNLKTVSRQLLVSGHGRLIEPPSRASAWRYGFDTPHNYNDHELFCGGFTNQWERNDGKCGVCGDAWQAKQPRAHEFGGTYGQGVIVRKYSGGGAITVRVELTASHMGYFQFALCPDYKTTTAKCLEKNRLKLVRTIDHLGDDPYYFYPKDGNKVYEIKVQLPRNTCAHCLFQWRYIAGNNWGMCSNGTGAVGCGPQEEFRACADIEIIAKSSTDEPLTTETPTPIEPLKGPISSLLISFMSFLLVCSLFSIIYLYFYGTTIDVADLWKKFNIRLQNDINYSKKKKTVVAVAPIPPPRTKKLSRCNSMEFNEEIINDFNERCIDSPA